MTAMSVVIIMLHGFDDGVVRWRRVKCDDSGTLEMRCGCRDDDSAVKVEPVRGLPILLTGVTHGASAREKERERENRRVGDEKLDGYTFWQETR